RRNLRLSRFERAPRAAGPQPRDGRQRSRRRLSPAHHRAAPHGALRRKGRSSGHQGDDMSQAAAMHGAVEPAESPLTPESWGKLGMWIFLAGDAVGFGTLLGAYGAVRGPSADGPNPHDRRGMALTALMTCLLICSSVTMVKALEAIKRGDRPAVKRFLLMTIAG